MPSSRRQHTTPVIVEVKPDSARRSDASIAPSTPPSPKQVRFAPRSSEVVTGSSRPLTPTEAWSFYHFETHARGCPECYDPYKVMLAGNRLCSTGHALAQDVLIHVFSQEGQVYSTKKDDHKLVRVEIQPGYNHTRNLLTSIERHLRAQRTVPIISYDKTYPVSARRTERDPESDYEESADVVVESRRSERKPSTSKSKHKSSRYSTVVVKDDVEASSSRRKEKRGSLYEKDTQRPRKEYVVEIREPRDQERKERRRKEERKSGYYS